MDEEFWQLAVNEERIREALTTVHSPGLSRDIVSFGFVEAVRIDGGGVTVRLNIPIGSPEHQQQIARASHDALMALDGVDSVSLEIEAPESKGAPATQPGRSPGGGSSIALFHPSRVTGPHQIAGSVSTRLISHFRGKEPTCRSLSK